MTPNANPFDLAGRAALVTGCGSEAGIGFACARLLARLGARVAITSTTERIRDREGELQIFGVRLVDDVEGGIALRVVVVMVHEPIVRLGIEQALIGDVRGMQRRCARSRARPFPAGRHGSCGRRS